MVHKIVRSVNTLNHNLEFHEQVVVPKLNFLNGMTLFLHTMANVFK